MRRLVVVLAAALMPLCAQAGFIEWLYQVSPDRREVGPFLCTACTPIDREPGGRISAWNEQQVNELQVGRYYGRPPVKGDEATICDGINCAEIRSVLYVNSGGTTTWTWWVDRVRPDVGNYVNAGSGLPPVIQSFVCSLEGKGVYAVGDSPGSTCRAAAAQWDAMNNTCTTIACVSQTTALLGCGWGRCLFNQRIVTTWIGWYAGYPPIEMNQPLNGYYTETTPVTSIGATVETASGPSTLDVLDLSGLNTTADGQAIPPGTVGVPVVVP